MELDNNGNHKALIDVITCRIEESLCAAIPFAEFMDLALYHPQYGYYATAPSKIGAAGDFVTSPHLSADFGELLAQQLVQMWEILQRPDRFTVVEMGAGQGILAADVIRELVRHADLRPCLAYRIVERSPQMRVEQQHQLQPWIEQGIDISWTTLEVIAPDSVVGCFVSNELVDALPVHQVQVQAGQLQEIYVTNATGDRDSASASFREVLRDVSTPRLTEYFQDIGINLLDARYPDGYRSEVNLAAVDWLAQVAQRLQRGYVLTIDYGYPSDRYYHPVRSAGTLQCYYRHQHHDNPYAYVGQQDITAHVDFTALARYGEMNGLHTVGFTKQGLFLMSLGLGDRLAALTQSHPDRDASDALTVNTILRRRDALQSLIDPMGLGNFGVLIHAKQVPATAHLDGLKGERMS